LAYAANSIVSNQTIGMPWGHSPCCKARLEVHVWTLHRAAIYRTERLTNWQFVRRSLRLQKVHSNHVDTNITPKTTIIP